MVELHDIVLVDGEKVTEKYLEWDTEVAIIWCRFFNRRATANGESVRAKIMLSRSVVATTKQPQNVE